MERQVMMIPKYDGVSVYATGIEDLVLSIPYHRIRKIAHTYNNTGLVVIHSLGGITYIKNMFAEGLVLGNTKKLYIWITKIEAENFIERLKEHLLDHNFMVAAKEAEANKPTLEERVAAIEQKLLALETDVPVLQL